MVMVAVLALSVALACSSRVSIQQPLAAQALLELDGNTSDLGMGPMAITVLHHNPHWECFSRDETGQCATKAWAQYSRFLQKYKVDFGSLVMGGDYNPSDGFEKIEHASGLDTVMLVYNRNYWNLEEHKGFHFEKERAFLAARFRSKRHNEFSVVVVSAHYSHHLHGRVSSGASNVQREVRKLKGEHTDNVILLADTNQQFRSKKAQEFLREMGCTTGMVWGDDVIGSCCLDSNFNGGGLSYDRTIANFGTRGERIDDDDYMKLTNNYKEGPAWAYNAKKWAGTTAAYHHPIMLKITL